MVRPAFQDKDEVAPFAPSPAAGVARVMVFGESSVRGGSGLPPEQEFPALLEAKLRAAGRDVEVINLGRPGLDSAGIRTLAFEAAAFHPAVFVVYAGHNDIGNGYMFERFHDVGSVAGARVRILLDHLQLYAALRQLVKAPVLGTRSPDPAPAAMSVAQRMVAAAGFKQNLARLVFEAQEAHVPVVLATVISRLDAWSTGQPVCPDALPPGTWVEQGGRWSLHARSGDDAAMLLAPSAAPDCPEAWFLRGQARLRAGDEGGVADLERARDLDVVPLRATAAIEDAIRAVGAASGAPVVDIASIARGRVRDGGRLFVDNLHLAAAGYAFVADALAPEVARALPSP